MLFKEMVYLFSNVAFLQQKKSIRLIVAYCNYM